MAHLLPSGYNTSYSNSEHAHYAADYSDAHETRPSYTDNYYYPQNQPAYDFVGHWQHPPAVPDQYTADQELVDRYLEPAALHSPSTTASSATLQIQGAGEQYTQAGYAENGFGGHVASSSSISCWDGQHQSYSQGNPHQNTDCDPTHYPNHSTNSQSPIYGPAPYPYPVAQGYGFESNDLSSAISTDRSGDATSPQPVDQHDWGNLSGSGQIEPRLDFGPFQAPKREPSSTVQTPASARNQDYRPLVPPTSHFSPSSSTLPFGFVQSQPHAETHPEMVQPSFFVPSHHRRLEQFKDHQRNRRAGRAAPSPYYCPTEDSHRHHHGTECSCTPLMDHLPLPDEAMQQGSPYQDETAQYAAMSPMSPDPPVVFSQPGPAVINNLGIAQLEQARAENCRKHDQHVNGERTYLPDRPDLPPAPLDEWARALPTKARPHPLVFSDDGFHPLVKPEPQEHAMSVSPSPVDNNTGMKAESPTAGAVPKPASTTTKKVCEKKPVLACLFCRGRKIACGPPLPGSKDKTCNQCARRHLKCVYPTESRRGQRKRVPKVPVEDDVTGAPVPPSIVSSGTQGVGSSSTKGNRKSRQSDRHGGGT